MHCWHTGTETFLEYLFECNLLKEMDSELNKIRTKYARNGSAENKPALILPAKVAIRRIQYWGWIGSRNVCVIRMTASRTSRRLFHGPTRATCSMVNLETWNRLSLILSQRWDGNIKIIIQCQACITFLFVLFHAGTSDIRGLLPLSHGDSTVAHDYCNYTGVRCVCLKEVTAPSMSPRIILQ